MQFHKKCLAKTILVCVSLWFWVSGFAYQALGAEDSNQTIRFIPEEEMPVILELISNDIRQNYEKIQTWSGEIDKKIIWVHTGNAAREMFVFTDGKGEIPRAILQKAEDKKTFAIDVNKDFLYVDTLREKPSRYFDYNTGNDLGNSKSSTVWSTKVARPDFLLKAEDASFEKGTGRLLHRRAVKEPSKREQKTGWYKLGDIWDPRRAFFPGAGFTWDDLAWSIKRINTYGKIEFDGYRFKVEEHKKGDNIEYKIISPSVVNLERSRPEHYAILTMIFSSQYGFNMIYWEAATGGGMVFQKYTWEYELIDGVYLPKRQIVKLYDANGVVTTEYDSTFKNNKANQEMSPGTFEPTNLNLKDGDVLIDEISKEEYRYEAATHTFKLAEKKKKSPPPEKSNIKTEPNSPPK